METYSKLTAKIKEVKEKPDAFVLTERHWTNCYAMKIKIKKIT